MGTYRKLALAFLAVKLSQVALLSAVPTQFDISSQLLLSQYNHEKEFILTFSTRLPLLGPLLAPLTSWFINSVLEKLVVWDAVYFADLFANEIQFEHQFVFCPLWWRLIRLIPVPEACRFYGRLLVATCITNVCHFLAAVVLFHYTRLVFQNARIFSPDRMAWASLLLFVMSPAAMFLTAPYSEAIAALSSFSSLLLREKALALKYGSARVNAPLYVLSGIAAALAYGFRANCLLIGLVYVYDLFARPLRISHILPIFAGLILGAALVLSQAANYVAVCYGTDRGEWCHSRIPSLFAYAQAHYWNNGFLRYWRVGNVPNFVFGAPTIFLSIFGIRYFRHDFPVDRIMPVLLVNITFLVLLLGFWHVQIVTRIHTFLPIVYWVVAGLVTQNAATTKTTPLWWPGYFVVWSVVQTCLFGAFLPPA